MNNRHITCTGKKDIVTLHTYHNLLMDLLQKWPFLSKLLIIHIKYIKIL